MALKFTLIAALSMACLSCFALPGECEIKIYAKFKTEFTDPIKAITWWDKKYVSLVYDTLIRFDENGNLSPGLASKWKVDRKNNTLTLTLKKDITFHDGTPISAVHVVKVLERLKTEKNPDRSKMSKVLTIKNLGPNIVEVRYDNLSSYDIYLLATPRFSIYKPESTRIGTGPWVFKGKDKNRLLFNSYQGSHYASNCKKLSTIDVTFKEAITLFKNNDLDIIEYISLSQKELAEVKEAIKEKGQFHAFKTFDTTILFYSKQSKEIDAVRKKLLHNLYQNSDLVRNSNDKIASNVIPPGISSLFEIPVQLEIKNDHWEPIPSTDIFVPDTTEYKGALINNISEIFKRHKNPINIKVVSLEQLYKLHHEGRVNFHVETVTLQAPHPYGILSMFHSKSGENFTGYNDPLFDRLLAKGLELEGEASSQHFREASDLIIKAGYAIPLVHQIKNVIISNKISGYNFSKISTYHEYYSTLSKSEGDR